ncbi:hypothetical protein KKA87_09070 [bacterium]|nr:hypothetical protein [bacterium]MBU1874099.1 hypothetical protein [bacterium]
MILKVTFIFIALYIFIKVLQKIPKTKKQKLKEEIRLKRENRDYLLGLSRPHEYHYYNDCDLNTRTHFKREYFEFTGPPSVLIGNKISLVWYSDRLLGGKIRHNYFYKDYQIYAFEEFTFDDNKEFQINHRIFSKETNYIGIITKGDFIYIEETFKDKKTIMCKMEVGNMVRIDNNNPDYYFTLKYVSGSVIYVPKATLRKIMVKEVVELKKLFPSINKPDHIKLSRRKLFFHMVRCRNIRRADSEQVIKQVVEEEGDTIKIEKIENIPSTVNFNI